MKTLYIDCSMGAAGDMLAAALLELMPDPDAALARLNSIGVPGVVYSRGKVLRCGVSAARLAVSVGGVEECGHGHGHGHDDPHGHHGHGHRSLADMLELVGSLALPQSVKDDVAGVYRLLADAEGRAHGCEVGEVHFHEVGALDAVADIAAVCWLLSELGADEVVASPVNVGGGTVRCAHGTMSVPAPATAFLLEGVPAHGDGDVLCELCTPTGAALLRRFASGFGPMPAMRAGKTGFGAGARDVPGRVNAVRATIGEPADAGGSDEVCEFVCSIDDMTGEDVAFACERIFEAGALDVLTVPATMKKGRPGLVLTALSPYGLRDAVAQAIFRHTTTLGVRERLCRRRVLGRREETLDMPEGLAVRRKVAEGFGVVREKLEHDDLAAFALASGISLADARAEARRLDRGGVFGKISAQSSEGESQ